MRRTRTLLLLCILLVTLIIYFLPDFALGRSAKVNGQGKNWGDVVIPRRSNLGLGGELRTNGSLERKENVAVVKRAGGNKKEGGRIVVWEERRGVHNGVPNGVPDGEVKLEFRIIQPFNFPQPTFSLPAPVLLRSRWVTDLQDYLRTAQGKTISVVTATVEHTDVLLNWLIAAYVKIAEPLQNVMVISMDAKLHSILVSRGIDSLYVHKDMVVSPTADVPRVFSQVHVVRLAVVRLMNHYGYDVINYDCDAIPLRNLQPIFDEYSGIDLIGTFGKGPSVLYDKWGVTLNTGVMVMRATSNMGEWVYTEY